MAKPKSNRFFGLLCKFKHGLSFAVLSYGELGNEFNRVWMCLGGDCNLFSISASVILFEIWNEFWKEVLTSWFVWDRTWILTAGRNIEGHSFQKKSLNGVCSWQIGVQTGIRYSVRAYLYFRESYLIQNFDLNRIALTSFVLAPISILLKLQEFFP